MTLLEKVKVILRITGNDFDEADVIPLMAACKRDIERNGIIYDENDPLIEQAVKVYCRANFGNNPNAERLQKSYEMLISSLALSGGDDGSNY
ncbi:hypothetical protein [Dielma fastidiosa]|uniref:Phage gp6-like head-tail connector protein n=1 Tax=Dielma fastidiosa TaxID=1034346 RepID=A0A318L2H5_9FIRM|nr:hypothetical protein [Dielma fastidiosa]PXX74653.1 hypothetical protein DES51_12239 [Dielma fastidiosa]